jgi:hypothetical protein
MPLEAKRSRHVAVAIPELCVSSAVAVSPRQERPQPRPGWTQTRRRAQSIDVADALLDERRKLDAANEGHIFPKLA